MTHESRAAVHDLEQAATLVEKLAKKNPELAEAAKELSKRFSKFKSYVEYSRLFIRKVGAEESSPINARGQINRITDIFGPFAKDRGIDVTCDAKGDVTTPPLPVVAYSGILVNLYTNALKAVMAVQSSLDDPKVCFHAWNEKKKHIVEVCDNGLGIPDELRKRIWDPLFTTTSDRGNPLGSGMGLGLTLVRQVASEFGGSVSLLSEPPPGFKTCFRVEFPF
jgi:signal transduction histidine kinase